MKDYEVPQDENILLEGGRKAVYALNERGEYALVPSSGWEAEAIVTSMAVDALKQQANEARARVLAGQSSPLEYHMFNQRMDLTILSQTTGIAKWRIRRHFRPSVFTRLSNSLTVRYAEALGLSVTELCKLD